MKRVAIIQSLSLSDIRTHGKLAGWHYMMTRGKQHSPAARTRCSCPTYQNH